MNDGPVLVVGGTGMLGGQVVTELLARGKQVRALVRPGSDGSRLEAAGAQVARGDMLDPASLSRAMEGVDAVITSAAGYTRHRNQQGAAQLVRIGAGSADVCAHRALVQVSCGRRRCARCGRPPHRRWLGPAGEHAGYCGYRRPAHRQDHPRPLRAHRFLAGRRDRAGASQSDGQGPFRHDRLVPDRPLCGGHSASAAILRRPTHCGGRRPPAHHRTWARSAGLASAGEASPTAKLACGDQVRHVVVPEGDRAAVVRVLDVAAVGYAVRPVVDVPRAVQRRLELVCACGEGAF